MAANTSPISPAAPATSWNATPVTSANTALDGTGTVGTVLTAGANGTRVGKVKVRHLGTNVATVLRVFMNNGSSSATAANNCLLAEKTIPANTLSQTAESVEQEILLNVYLKPSYKLNYSIGTAVASGHAVSAPEAGDY